MTLASASTFFDRTSVKDVASGAHLFYAQLDLYDDAKRDSASAYRRVMSVAPGTEMPISRVARILGSVWVIGGRAVDGMAGVHREKYVLHPAPSPLWVRSLSDYVTGGPGKAYWGDIAWLKDGKEESTSSKPAPAYSAYLPQYADIAEFDVVQVAPQEVSNLYQYFMEYPEVNGHLVGVPRLTESGFTEATCARLEYPPADAVLSTRIYDPVQGMYTSSVPTQVKCLRARWQSLYSYGSQADAKYQEGDCSLVLPAGTVIATKDQVTLAGQVWGILSVEELGGAVVAHARRV